MEIHRSICGSWATINIKDIIFTMVMIFPWVLSFFIPSPWNWMIRFIAFISLWYEPAQFIFPSNIITSLLLHGRPAVFTNDELHSLFPNHLLLFENPENFTKIQKELLSIEHDSIPYTRDALPNQHYIGSETKWRLLPIKTVGKVHDHNARRVPFLMSLVNQCPEIVTVFYSKLEGGSYIPPHAGYLKGILRYHLGIQIPEPEKCYIQVDGHALHWKEGHGILFDDMYLHSVRHNGSQIRSILWFDVIRNDLNFVPLWKKWTLQLVKIITNSHWMQKANAQTEQVQIRTLKSKSRKAD